MIRALLLFLFALAFAGRNLDAAERKALPPADSIEAAKRLAYDAFRSELAAPDKAPAVKAMLEAARTTAGDAEKAALSLAAAEVAADAGEAALAFEAVDALGERFEIDALAVKGEFLDRGAKSAKTTKARVNVVNAGLGLVSKMIAASRFEEAEAALKAAGAAAAKLREPELRKAIAAARKEFDKTKRQREHAQALADAARNILKEKPDDPAANEALGKYLAFDRKDWPAGLKHLAKAEDRELQKAALADQAGATTGFQAATLGDWWWDLGGKAAGAGDRLGFYSRAVFWYVRALPEMTGLAKTRIERRLIEAGEEAAAGAAEQSGNDNGRFIAVTLAPGVTLQLVKIPASDDGKVKSFYLGQTEVTQKQWQAVMGNNPSLRKADKLPVGGVTLKECRIFIEKINRLSDRLRFRLPNNNELTHAYLAGLPHSYYMSRLDEYFWNFDNAERVLHPVASLRANPWGLYDALGNAGEWSDDGTFFGGSIWDKISIQKEGPVIRKFDQPSDNAIGFRVAADLQ